MRAQDQFGAFACDVDWAGVGAVVIVKRDVMGDQQARWWAAQHANLEVDDMCLTLCAGRDLHTLHRVGVEPVTLTRRRCPGRRLVEQQPLTVTLDKHALPECAKQSEVSTARGQQAIDADMALGQQGIEDAAHPGGGGERRFIGHQGRAAAQDLGMGALHHALLGARYKMHFVLMKTRDFDAVARFAEHGRAVVCGELLQRASFRREQRGMTEQADRQRMHRGRNGWQRGRTGFWQCEGLGQRGEIVGAADLRVMDRKATDEAAARALSWRKCEGRILQGDERVLMLQTQAGQAVAERARSRTGASGKTVELQRIGGVADSARQGCQQTPGIAPAHRLVLTRGQHMTHTRVQQGRVIEVLTGEIFVGTNETVVREAEILRMDQIERDRGRPGIDQLHMPEPHRCVRGEAQRHTILNRFPSAAQGIARGVVFALGRAPRTEQHGCGGMIAKAAQIKVGGTAFHDIAAKQIEHDVIVIDARQRAVGVDADAQSGGVLDDMTAHG